MKTDNFHHFKKFYTLAKIFCSNRGVLNEIKLTDYMITNLSHNKYPGLSDVFQESQRKNGYFDLDRLLDFYLQHVDIDQLEIDTQAILECLTFTSLEKERWFKQIPNPYLHFVTGEMTLKSSMYAQMKGMILYMDKSRPLQNLETVVDFIKQYHLSNYKGTAIIWVNFILNQTKYVRSDDGNLDLFTAVSRGLGNELAEQMQIDFPMIPSLAVEKYVDLSIISTRVQEALPMMVREIVQKHPKQYANITPSLKNDPDMALIAIKRGYFKVSKKFQYKFLDLLIKIGKMNPLNTIGQLVAQDILLESPDLLRALVTSFLKHNESNSNELFNAFFDSLHYPLFIAHPDIIGLLIRHKPDIISKILTSPPIANNANVINYFAKIAVNEKPSTIAYFTTEYLLQHSDLCLTAMKKNPNVVQYLPAAIILENEIILRLIQQVEDDTLEKLPGSVLRYFVMRENILAQQQQLAEERGGERSKRRKL